MNKPVTDRAIPFERNPVFNIGDDPTTVEEEELTHRVGKKSSTWDSCYITFLSDDKRVCVYLFFFYFFIIYYY